MHTGTIFAKHKPEGVAGEMSKAKVVMVEPTLEKIIAARNTSRKSLDVPCPGNICNEIALKLTNWKLLAPFLKLEETDEADIDADYRRNIEKKIGILRVWKQKFGDSATYLCLLDAFEILKWRDVIIHLLDLFDRDRQDLKVSAKTVTVPKLDDRPKAHELIRVVGQSGKEIVIRDLLASRWEDLYLELLRPPSPSSFMIENISKNCHYQVEECCREMFLKWLSGDSCSSEPVTWRTLIRAVRKVSFDTLADELEQELKQ